MKYIMDCYESVSGFLSSLCPKKKGENAPQNNFKLCKNNELEFKVESSIIDINDNYDKNEDKKKKKKASKEEKNKNKRVEMQNFLNDSFSMLINDKNNNDNFQLLEKKRKLDEKQKKSEIQLNKQEKEQNKKEIQLNKIIEEQKQKEKELKLNIEEKDNNIKKLEKTNKELLNENSIIKNEKLELIKKNEEIEKNYKKLIKEKNEIEINLNNLNKKQEESNEKEIQINKIKEEQKIKEIEIDKKNKEQKILEIQLNNKKEELEKREQKFEEVKNKENIKLQNKEISLTKLENSLSLKNKEILDKKEDLIKKEDLLKEKENKFFIDIKKREDKLKEDQKKFNKEKLFYENTIDQKEDSFKKRELAIRNDKILLENERKKLEMAKLPTEIGLQNIGATCYMNATLQALSNTEKFTEFFLKNYQYNQNNHNRKMSNEMYKVLFNLWSEEKKKGDYPPYDFKKALSEENPLFAGIQANDSKDLINFLLERFHQELNNANIIINNQGNNFVIDQTNEIQTLNNFITDYFNNNKSIITDCFYGLLETKSKCGGCNCIKYNFQIYSFLEFPLKDINNYMYQNGRRYALVNQDGTNPDIDLYECFDYYQKIELMTGPNQMYCNICNGNRDTFYGSLIYSLPNYLIINLNRGKGAVYSCNVKFPDTLNLLNYVTYKDGITAMKLYAVICHYGPSNMGGHFIAFCRHRITNKWYKYNDSIVTLCTKDKEYLQGMPYILFYKAI